MLQGIAGSRWWSIRLSGRGDIEHIADKLSVKHIHIILNWKPAPIVRGKRGVGLKAQERHSRPSFLSLSLSRAISHFYPNVAREGRELRSRTCNSSVLYWTVCLHASSLFQVGCRSAVAWTPSSSLSNLHSEIYFNYIELLDNVSSLEKRCQLYHNKGALMAIWVLSLPYLQMVLHVNAIKCSRITESTAKTNNSHMRKHMTTASL